MVGGWEPGPHIPPGFEVLHGAMRGWRAYMMDRAIILYERDDRPWWQRLVERGFIRRSERNPWSEK